MKIRFLRFLVCHQERDRNDGLQVISRIRFDMSFLVCEQEKRYCRKVLNSMQPNSYINTCLLTTINKKIWEKQWAKWIYVSIFWASDAECEQQSTLFAPLWEAIKTIFKENTDFIDEIEATEADVTFTTIASDVNGIEFLPFRRWRISLACK